MSRGGQVVLALGLGLVTAGLGVVLVWVNIERLDLAYEVKQLERELARQSELREKLKVERHYLLSPAALRAKAEAHGLKPPAREQIRVVP